MGYNALYGHKYSPLQLQQAPLFWEGFPQHFGVSLWEFVPIQSKEYLCGQALMVDGKAWVSNQCSIHPKGAQWGCGQGSGVLPHQTLQTMSL